MLSNCSQCQYFDHQPNHKNDIRCAIAPAYTSMWLKLKSLDESTLNAVPVNSCHDFDLDSRLEKKEISLALTYQQWQSLARNTSNREIMDFLAFEKVIEHSFSLTIADWQAIANSTQDSQVLSVLAQQGVEPEEEEEEQWHTVDSSCINAIAFDHSQSYLYIRFHSQSVYQYRQVCSDIFEEFLEAASKGQFFNYHIKDEFPHRLYA
ncbi:MAG: KTSC domain-containing protein [Cyanobacteria bacterium J06600_6]